MVATIKVPTLVQAYVMFSRASSLTRTCCSKFFHQSICCWFRAKWNAGKPTCKFATLFF